MLLTMVDLTVKAGGLTLKNPIVIEAAGYVVDGWGLRKMIKTGAGAVTTKSMTYRPFQGGPKPRCYWYDSAKRSMNADEALLNPGFRKACDFIKENREFAKQENCRVVGSFSPRTLEEASEMASALEDAGADAVHMDLQCPTAGPFREKQYPNEQWDRLGSWWSEDPERAASVIRVVKNAVDIPVWPKPLMFRWNTNADAIKTMDAAKPDLYAYMHPGAPVMQIDVYTGRPKRAPVPGRKEAAIKLTADLARLSEVDLLPSGGFKNAEDVLQGLMAGASVIGLSTAIYANPGIVQEIVADLESYMELQQKLTMDEIIGATLQFLAPKPGPESDYYNLFITRYLRPSEGDYEWGWTQTKRRPSVKQETAAQR